MNNNRYIVSKLGLILALSTLKLVPFFSSFIVITYFFMKRVSTNVFSIILILYLIINFLVFSNSLSNEIAINTALYEILFIYFFITFTRLIPSMKDNEIKSFIFLSLIFQYSSLVIFKIFSIYPYIGGYAGGTFEIVNDFSTQLILVGWAFMIFEKGSMKSLLNFILIIFLCYLNNSRAAMLSSIIILIHTYFSRPYLFSALVGSILITLLYYYNLLQPIFDVYTLGTSEVPCGSECFRIWALVNYFNQWLSNSMFGLGIGHITNDLIFLQDTNNSFVMAGSIHNTPLQIFFEVGIVGALLIFLSSYSVRTKLASPYIIGILFIVMSGPSTSILSASCIPFLLALIIYKTSYKL